MSEWTCPDCGDVLVTYGSGSWSVGVECACGFFDTWEEESEPEYR